jgi:sec-independent protein translocase protein TatB
VLNLDPGKLLIIGVVAILLLGPERLPQVARQVGAIWTSFNEFRHRMEAEVRSNIPDLPSTSDLAHLARSPSALLNHLGNMGSSDEVDPVAPNEMTRATSAQTPEKRPVGSEMSWVTADFSPETSESSPEETHRRSGQILPLPEPSTRPLESVAGDANLN